MIRLPLRLVDWGSRRIGIEPKKGRFLAVGGVNLLFGISSYALLLWLLADYGNGYLFALALSQFVSLIFAFVNQKMIVFNTSGNVLSEFGRFSSFYLTNYAVNWAILPLLVEFFRLDAFVSQIGFTIGMVFISYFWHNGVTFRQGRSG